MVRIHELVNPNTADYVWAEDSVSDTIDPWVNMKPDSKKQTGGDWYRLFLTASLGGKAVHGANTSPSCEVLCKSTKKQLADGNYGVLRWDDTIKAESPLGEDVSDQFYVHPTYRGNVTASGSILAYESGLWEPSVRRRARASALLAAGFAVHGMSSEDACRVVSRITAERLDVSSVDSVILPASHLKREMVIVSKASHRVFSKGTIQSGISWYDDRLVSRSNIKNMAFDWGRVTAIARYIAEANIQKCTTFRRNAKAYGIPFTVVRNAWAYVSDADYNVPVDMFSRVPALDITKYGIPSLVGSFVGHEQDVMNALNRGSKYLSFIPESESFRAYVKLYKEARAKRGRKLTRRPPLPSEAREVNVMEHTLADDDLVGLMEGGKIIKDAIIVAIASRRKADKELDSLLTKAAAADLSNIEDLQLVDRVSRLIYEPATWLVARTVAEDTLKEKDPTVETERPHLIERIITRLCDQKTEIFGFYSHLETSVVASVSQIIAVRARTKTLAIQSSAEVRHIQFSQRTLASSQAKATALALGSIGATGSSTLGELKVQTAPIFEDWYAKVASDQDAKIRERLVYFAYVAAFIEGLTNGLCYQKVSGYIEGALPEKSYVYRALLRTAPDYKFTPPKLQRLAYTDAMQIARELDVTGVIPYSVSGALESTLKVADQVVGDLMHGSVWTPDPQLYVDSCLIYGEPISPGYDDSMMVEAEQAAIMYQMLMEEEADRVTNVAFGYNDCLNTYPSQFLADEIARANGYPNLQAAFDILGEDACNTETSQFAINGMAILNERRVQAEHGGDGTGPSSKRKYDAIL